MADAKDKCKFGNTRLYETANGQCKLSVANVRSIRRKYATGKWLQRELAAEYGVSQTLISAIIRRTRRRVLRYAKVKEDAA